MKRLLAGALALALSSPAWAAFNQVENVSFANISATTAGFTLRGGNYGLTCDATFGGGNIALQRQAGDGTYVTVITALTAAGYSNANLPAGTYRLAITTATAVYCDVTATVTTQ